jgi:predicted neuraminidase
MFFLGLSLIFTQALGSACAQTGSDGFIFQPLVKGQTPSAVQPDNHASTLVELKNRDILAAWFAGSKEGAPDVAIYGARLHAGQWSAPVELARAAKLACWNPVLFHTLDGRLWLYYKVGDSPTTWTGLRKFSRDDGRTWSAAAKLPDGILGPIKDKPLVLPNGVIVSGSSVENGKWTAWVERSTDDGRSWHKFGPITVPDSLDQPDAGARAASAIVQAPVRPEDEGVVTTLYPPAPETAGIIQPSIVSLGGHHLRLYARSKTKAARIAVADSADDGLTWSQARFIDLPNPNSGIDALRLRDGRIVLVFNNSYNRRSPLNLAVSQDGEHFTVVKTLEDGPGQYSYPAIVQAANGDLLMTYSYQRRTIKFVRLALSELPPPARGKL